MVPNLPTDTILIHCFVEENDYSMLAGDETPKLKAGRGEMKKKRHKRYNMEKHGKGILDVHSMLYVVPKTDVL